MRITIVAPQISAFTISSGLKSGLGGIETACIELSRSLAERGHTIILVSKACSTQREGGVLNVPFSQLDKCEGDAVLVCNDARFLRRGAHR